MRLHFTKASLATLLLALSALTAEDVLTKVEDTAKDVAHAAKSELNSVKEDVKDAAKKVEEKVETAVADTDKTVEEVATKTEEKAKKAVHKVKTSTTHHGINKSKAAEETDSLNGVLPVTESTSCGCSAN